MNKKMWWSAIAAAVVVASALFLFGKQQKAVAPVVNAFDPLNATYIIEGQPVALVNGKAQTPVNLGAAEQITTSVFGDPAVGDLNKDGVSDAALILVQSSGGSGTFYYVAAAINATSGVEGSNAVLLGDRIAPQNISIQGGRITANYADRAAGEPMIMQPSIGVTKYLSYRNGTLTIISQQ